MGLIRPITGLIAPRGLVEVERGHALAPRLFWLAGHRGALIDELVQRRHVLKGSTAGALSPTIGGLAARAASGFTETLQPPSSNAALGINDKISIVWIGQRNGTAGGIVPFGRPHASAPSSPYADFTFYCGATYMECRFTNTGGSTTTAGGFFTIYPAPEIWVATWDGTNIALYQNGVSVATGSLAGPVADSTGKGISLGDSGTTIPWDFIAASIYNRALTAAEVLALSRSPYQFLRPAFPPQIKASAAGGAITLNADQGTVTVTGYAATTRFSVAAAQGTVAVSGQAATASFGMAAAQGSVAVTGQASTVAWLTAAAQGSVSVAGQAATVNWQMAGAQGTVAITGYDATFDGLAGLVMNADTGFITVAGQDASASWSVAAAQGSISVSGQASAVLWGLNADLGTLALVGYDADFDGVTDAPATTTGGKPRKAKGKRRKVLVGERVFWSDQKAAIARAIAELQAERAQARAEKIARPAAASQIAPVEMNFAPLAGITAADIKAMQADDDEDDIECLLMCL